MLSRSVVQLLAAFCHCNCELMSSSVHGGLRHPNGVQTLPNISLLSWLKRPASSSQQTPMREDHLDPLQLSVLCWAELMQ